MKNNEEELKTVEFTLEEGDDLYAVSIVKDPAIEKSFQLFNALKMVKKEVFKTTSNDKQEITGPVMIPDIKILRYNKETDEYYNCFFTEKTVKECASIYLKNCNHTTANFDHVEMYTNQVFTIESWIVEDPENDKSKALGFEDVKKGTWFMTYSVADENLWKEIKSGDFTGFSIEGWFTRFNTIKNKEKLIYQILNSSLKDEDKESFIKKIISTIK